MPKKITKHSYNNCLAVNKIHLSVRLGCEKEERKTPQAVEVDIKLFYPSLTKASKTDQDDFACYDKISRLVWKLCEKKEFRLIEYLGAEIYRTIRPTVAKEVKILVKITKCNLPVSFVLGGASFTYSDLPPFSWIVPD